MYSSVVFSIAQLTAEMPYSVLCAVVFFLLFYFPCVPFFVQTVPYLALLTPYLPFFPQDGLQLQPFASRIPVLDHPDRRSVQCHPRSDGCGPLAYHSGRCLVYVLSPHSLTHSLHPSGTDRSLTFTVNPFLLVIFSLFCGVTIPKPQLPHFWRGASGDFFSSHL